MNRSTIVNIVRILITVLWRAALTAAVLAGLCILGGAMALNLMLNGPSLTARDQLTLTLLESEQTSRLPGYFLSQETIDQIRSNVTSPAGSNDPALITVGGEDEVRTGSHSFEDFNAQVWVLPNSTNVHLVSNTNGLNGHYILTDEMWNSTHQAAINDEGVLLISDDPNDLIDMDPVGCGPVLIQNGTVNHALFQGASSISPRAAIGQSADGALIFITTDGWTKDHLGATHQDIINLMVHYGAVNACLLDRDATYGKEG